MKPISMQSDRFTMVEKLSLESIFVISPDMAVSEVEGQVMIVPLSSGMDYHEDELFALNSTGQLIWRQLDGEKTLSLVADTLANTYHLPIEEIETDLLDFINELIQLKIITKIES